jgi:hypothetical protein
VEVFSAGLAALGLTPEQVPSWIAEGIPPDLPAGAALHAAEAAADLARQVAATDPDTPLGRWVSRLAWWVRERDRLDQLSARMAWLEPQEAAWAAAADRGAPVPPPPPPLPRPLPPAPVPGAEAYTPFLGGAPPEDRPRLAAWTALVAALRHLALPSPETPPEAYMRDAAQVGALAGAAHYRAFERAHDIEVMEWHIAGCRWVEDRRPRPDPNRDRPG